MKKGTLILSLLFITLTIQPAFIKWKDKSCAKQATTGKVLTGTTGCKKASEKKCSSKKETGQVPEKQQSEDPCNTCNPFMVCNGCAYMPGEQQEVPVPVPVNAENTNGFTDTSLPSFEDDSWHPPELFMRL